MKLGKEELNTLAANSLSMQNAKAIGMHIDEDHSVGGIFPNGKSGDFSNPDIEKFKNKWCSWWPIAKILLNIAKVFTKEKGDKVLDALLELGNTVCVKDDE